MRADDKRHGTVAGYFKGCREDCCRLARNAYERNRRKRLEAFGERRLIDATGTVRRIQALMALGWPSRELAVRCGWTHGEAILEISRRETVQRKTVATIARLYDELSMIPGPSAETKKRAIRKGWAPPLAWDEGEIDDPKARPHGKAVARACVDPMVVDRVLGGEWQIKTSKAEKVEVIARWAANGGSLVGLERLTGWNVHRYVRGANPDEVAA